MAIVIANNAPRIHYTVAAGVTQTSFAIPFEFFEDDEVTMYVDGVAKTITTDYTISGGSGSTGTITMVTATPPAVQQVLGATGGSTVTIVRDIPIERITDFTAGSAISRPALNEQLDVLTALVADLNDRVSRSLELNDYEIASSTTLPAVDDRKGKYLSFNPSTGAPETGPDTANVNTLAAITDAIKTLADLENGTVATTGLSRLAAIDTDMTALADITQEIIDCANGLVHVIPVSRGGTGATTVAGAQENLGIATADTALALSIALGQEKIMADDANITITATVLPDEIQKSFISTMTVSPSDGNDKWYYKLSSVNNTSSDLMAGYYTDYTAVDSSTAPTAVNAADKVNFLYVKNTDSAESVYIVLDAGTASSTAADGITLGPSEALALRLPNATVADIHAVSSAGTVECIVCALLDDVA